MNKIYKIIWSDARKCYVVVAEIAKNRGKNNVRTIVEGLSAHALVRAGRWALPFVAAGALLLPVSAWATTITPTTSPLPWTTESWMKPYSLFRIRKVNAHYPGVTGVLFRKTMTSSRLSGKAIARQEMWINL